MSLEDLRQQQAAEVHEETEIEVATSDVKAAVKQEVQRVSPSVPGNPVLSGRAASNQYFPPHRSSNFPGPYERNPPPDHGQAPATAAALAPTLAVWNAYHRMTEKDAKGKEVIVKSKLSRASCIASWSVDLFRICVDKWEIFHSTALGSLQPPET